MVEKEDWMHGSQEEEEEEEDLGMGDGPPSLKLLGPWRSYSSILIEMLFHLFWVLTRVFLARLELGHSLAVSGDTPMSLLVTFSRFNPSASLECWAKSLNNWRSTRARATRWVLHISHMYGEILPSWPK